MHHGLTWDNPSVMLIEHTWLYFLWQWQAAGTHGKVVASVSPTQLFTVESAIPRIFMKMGLFERTLKDAWLQCFLKSFLRNYVHTLFWYMNCLTFLWFFFTPSRAIVCVLILGFKKGNMDPWAYATAPFFFISAFYKRLEEEQSCILLLWGYDMKGQRSA